MSTDLLDLPALEAIAELNHIENLATAAEKLAALRFLIVLTARWESSDSIEPERREQLRRDLVLLRTQYFGKIDEIAMNHGVQQAMDTKEEVECQVQVPRGARPPMRARDSEQAWF